MNDFGKNFRILRKERGFTLKEMSEGIISFSYLSKFEKGESDITLTNFIKLIERLNMTIDDFLCINSIKTTQHNELFQKVSVAYKNNDSESLSTYIKVEKQLYNQTGIIFHKCNYIMILTILQDIDSTTHIPMEDIEFLIDYIVTCSFWSSYEISIIGNTLSIYPENLLYILLEEVKKRIQEYRVEQKNIWDLVALIENTCIILLRKKQISQAKSLSRFLESLLEPFNFFERTRKLFIDGVILIGEGKKKEGKEQAEQAIDIMNVMDPNFAADHRIELNNFLLLTFYAV